MTKAQVAWAAHTALFLVAAVILTLFGEGDGAAAVSITSYCIAVLGWLMLGLMIFNDRNPDGP